MYRPKHEHPRKGLAKYKKSHILLVSFLLIMTIGIGATVAFLMDSTDALVNIFTPTYVSCEVNETFVDNVKTNVSIKNTSNIPAYIRAEVIVTWQDANGNVYGKMPVAYMDYDIQFATGAGTWYEDGGYYYYPNSIPAGRNTGILITKCQPLKDAPATGYYLCVEIIAEAIQAEGMGAASAQDAFAKAGGGA